jgi:radical SAM-linked protein
METDPFVDLLQATKDLNAALPAGIRIVESRIIPKKAPSLSGCISRYIYEVAIPDEHAKNVHARIKEFLARESVLVEKDGKQKDIRPGMEAMVLKGPNLVEIVLQDSEKAKSRIQDVIEKLFAISHEQSVLFGVKRTAMFVKDNGAWLSPMDVT